MPVHRYCPHSSVACRRDDDRYIAICDRATAADGAIRSTIESVDGAVLMIKSREGADMKVRMTDNVAVFGVAKTALSEIKEGSYIGVTAMPEPDGTQKAVAVHIFRRTSAARRKVFGPGTSAPARP